MEMSGEIAEGNSAGGEGGLGLPNEGPLASKQRATGGGRWGFGLPNEGPLVSKQRATGGGANSPVGGMAALFNFFVLASDAFV